MSDELVKALRQRAIARISLKAPTRTDRFDAELDKESADCIEALQAERDEARRRRDEWRKKAEGYDDVRRALREKVGAPWPPNMSRLMWAGIAADEKKRADDAEAERDENEGAMKVWRRRCQEAEAERDAAVLAEREKIIDLIDAHFSGGLIEQMKDAIHARRYEEPRE